MLGCRKPPGDNEPQPRAVASTENDSRPSENGQVAATPASPLIIAPGVGDEHFVGPLADAYRRLDPRQDGWETEVVGAAVQDQLKHIATWMMQSPLPGDAAWSTVAGPRLQMDDLVPAELTTVFQQEKVVVKRASDLSDTSRQLPADEARHGGRELLSQRLRELQGEFHTKPDHVKFKVYRVESRNGETTTMVYFHANGPSQDGLLEISATWKCHWATAKAGKPLLTGVQLEDFEMVELRGQSQPLFADCTASILDHETAYHQQLLRGTDYWRSRLARDLGLDVVANHGLALGDVNGDMLEDIYVCQQGGLPNRLFLQNQDGTLRDATETSGADWLDYCASALLVDLDNNGATDLVVGQELRVLILENDGNGRFRLTTEIPAMAQVFSMSAADFDQDGDLDVFVCGYNPKKEKARTGAMGEPIPYHDAQNGGENMLLRNNGNWEFVNAAGQTGLSANNNRFSFAAAWEDYDNDGDQDLYVANDYGRNNLYRNDNGHFQDVAGELGVEDMSAGMSVSWVDYNRDGWMDFYVSNMFSAAGNRITYQRQFQEGVADETKQGFQRHARGNSLFENTGDGRFRDVSVNSRVTMGRWAWGNRFVDFNNDSWEDLVVANGFISSDDSGDL